MQSIVYNISNVYFPVTATLKEGVSPGGATIATNIHYIAGEYSFDDIVSGQYCIQVVDAWGCNYFTDVPEVTTTLAPTTTEVTTTLPS